jgi:hypothetical protein
MSADEPDMDTEQLPIAREGPSEHAPGGQRGRTRADGR